MEWNVLALALNRLGPLVKDGTDFLPEVNLVFKKDAINQLAFLDHWHNQKRIQMRPGHLILIQAVTLTQSWERDENRTIPVCIAQGYVNYFSRTFNDVLENISLPEKEEHALSFMTKRPKERDQKLAEMTKHIRGDQELSSLLKEWGLTLETKFKDHSTLPAFLLHVKGADRPIFELELDGLSGLLIMDGELTSERYQKPATAIRALRTGTLKSIESITS